MYMVPIEIAVLSKLNQLKTEEDYTKAGDIYIKEGLYIWLNFLQEKEVFPNEEIFVLIKYHCSVYAIDRDNYSEPDTDYIERVFDVIKPTKK